jgi:YVTN family beta-propeller protein
MDKTLCRAWQVGLLAAAHLQLVACGGGGGNPPGSVHPGALQLTASAFAVDESAGTASVGIARVGGSDGAVTVTLRSTDGTATAGQDYRVVSSTVSWPAGDSTEKTVLVEILNDTDFEPDQTLTLSLSAPTGGATLGALTTATLTIRDDDPPPPVGRFVGPTSSQPLALTANDAYLCVANPDNDSVTFFEVHRDRNVRLAEVAVQSEPSGVAFLPDGTKAYVANTVSGTVSVIPTDFAAGTIGPPSKHIVVGVEPYGLAMAPNGKKLYVGNARSGSISVIDTATDSVVKTTQLVGIEPRGLAITNNGDSSDIDETLYLTRFHASKVIGKADGQDDAKTGGVTAISTATDTVFKDIAISPLADTGFKALGDAIARVPPGDPANPASFQFVTGAYPNQLNGAAIRGDFLFVPSTGASPNGPIRFDVNTQGLLSAINRVTNADANQTINLNLPVKNQAGSARLFVTQPWAIAFKHQSDEGFVVSAASNHLVKVTVNPVTGATAVASDPGDPSRVLQIKVGKNPRGIVISSDDSRAYVMNHVSRDVSVVKLSSSPEVVLATLEGASLPAPGSQAELIQVGKELYNTSIGEFDPAPGSSTPITGRMSKDGWGSCSACHPFGLSDNVTWIFPSGPRRTISQHTDFDQTVAARDVMRVLNWSAERDEEEDFELNIRNVSGGLGLIVEADGVTPAANVTPLAPLANGGRNQLKVRGVPAWDALGAYVKFGIRAPLSPVSKTDPTVISGRALFISANCKSCHGGPQWTSARVRFTPPPAAALVDVYGELSGELRTVGTFDSSALNEIRDNTGTALGASGFAPPSLLSIHAVPQGFFHGGAAATLDDVLLNVQHRSAGTGGVDTLANAGDRAAVVQFLRSIDAASQPIP